MKKASIVYFCIGCVCLILVPVMAFVFLPVAFVYLLPAAIFFWLSKDVIVAVSKKPIDFISSLIKKITDNSKNISKSISSKKDATAEASDIKPESIEEPVVEKTVVEEPVAEEPAVEEPAVEEPTAEEPVPESIEETETTKVEPSEKAAENEVKNTSVGEQMTIDEAVAKPIADEPTKEDPSADVTEKEDPPPVAEAEAEPETDDIEYEREAVDILAGAKRGLRSVFGKVKSIAKSSKIGDRADETDYGYIHGGADESSKGAKWSSTQKNDDYKDIDSSDVEEVIKKQFDNLDMITTSAIGIMLSDTKTKAASPYIRTLKKPDIRVILLKFCQDSFYATNMDQLNKLFSKSYYKWKIRRYLGRVTVFVKRGIGDSLPKRSALSKARVTKNIFINKICETIGTFESVKYISSLSGNEEISDTKRNYKLDHLSENYKDALIYLVDLLLTCTCISKMLFVERMIRRMNVNSEFNKIITNMAQSIDNHNLIISKSRPIYKQYYQSELGYINGDDLLYGMAITIMVNRAKKVDIKNTDVLQVNRTISNTQAFKQDMLRWLDGLSKEDKVDDIGTLILQRITLSIHDNYGLLTNALQELTNWENYYEQRVAFYKKEKDKERYLKGDFEKEKEEIVKIR